MSVSTGETPSITVVNVVQVDIARQQQVVDALHDLARDVLSSQPGFISCKVLKSLDGRRVVVYGRWESRTAFEAIFAKPEVVERLRIMLDLGTPEWHLYTVSHEVCGG